MGISFSKLFSNLFSSLKDVRIAMLGLDAAGKTTILYKLKLGEVVTTIPTIGFNVETVEYKSLNMTVWDVGGQERLRPLWRHYYNNCAAVIFVVDSSDIERVKEAQEEVHRMMQEDELQDATLLVFANKMDMPRVYSAAELAEKLNLGGIKQQWHVQPTCATTGVGLYEGLDWLCEALKNKKRS